MARVTVTALGEHVLEAPVLMGSGRMTPKTVLDSVSPPLSEMEPVLLTVCLYSASVAQGRSEAGSGF